MAKSAAFLWVVMAVSDDILPSAHRLLLVKMYRLDNGPRGCTATAEKLSLYTGFRPTTVDTYRRELAAVRLVQRIPRTHGWHATIPADAVPRVERPTDGEIRERALALERYITNGRPLANPRQGSGKSDGSFQTGVGQIPDARLANSQTGATQKPDPHQEYATHEFKPRIRKVVGEVPRKAETVVAPLLMSTPELQLHTHESAAHADKPDSGDNVQPPTPATRAEPDDKARIATEVTAKWEAKRRMLIEEPNVKPDVVAEGTAVEPDPEGLFDEEELDDDLPF